MEISVSIEKFVAVPDSQLALVELRSSAVTVKLTAEDALALARKIELAASEALGISA